MAEAFNFRPLLFGVRPGDARSFANAPDGHFVAEFGFAEFERAGDGGGAAGVGRAGEGDVPFAGEHAGGGVKADPARARKVDLGPGVEIGEVGCGTGGSVERFDVRGELNEIAGDEAGGEAEMAQDLDQEPGGIAAGTGGLSESVFAGLDAGFKADDVADIVLETLVQADEEIHRADRGAIDFGEPCGEGRAELLGFEKGPEFAGGGFVVGERVLFGGGFEEKIEGVVDRHVCHEVDFDEEVVGGFGEDEAGEVVGLRVLLPVNEVVGGLDLQGIRQNGRAAVRRGAQADDLGTEMNLAIVTILSFMIQRYVDRHGSLLWCAKPLQDKVF